MKYQFILTYTPTEGAALPERICYPTYSDSLAIAIEKQADEWFRTRKLDGRLTFLRDDYNYIMSCPFDGTFTLTLEASTNGIDFQPYITGTFSRANLEIDEDNRRATLTGITESGEYKIIDNARREEYDLMKIIPDGDAKEVQGQVHPALALVDYRNDNITQSDIFCGSSIVAAGYKKQEDIGWTNVALNGGGSNQWSATGAYQRVSTDSKFSIIGIYAEAKVEMKEGYTELDGLYAGVLQYSEIPVQYDVVPSYTSVSGNLYKSGSTDRLAIIFPGGYGGTMELTCQPIHNNVSQGFWTLFQANGSVFSPSSIDLIENAQFNQHFKKVTFYFHYIRATLLTQSGGNADNVLDTGAYYKRMAAFVNDGGLQIYASSNTTDQPNGYRLIQGTGEQGTTPQYFAPPDDQHDYIPLAEANWNYGSLWYTIQPSVANGLLDETKIGSFRWTRCWELGTCLRYLIAKVTNNKVTFSESTAGSEYLYADVNPVTGGEPFRYLFTQKSNVMRPSDSGESAARCTVTLDWFLELLRNAFNCHWWLEPVNGGTYAFRVEHVEYFRRGNSYDPSPDDTDIINLAALQPTRNYLVNGHPAKHLDDNLHRYTYDLNNMVERYTFSWQGDGGSDDFKGNPMFFKAGWIERGSVENRQVDNIFADLPWLMLNAGTDTASSKNYEGLFVFSGYRRQTADWTENHQPLDQCLVLAEGLLLDVDIILWCSAPAGHIISVALDNGQTTTLISEHTATGNLQPISVQFAAAALTSSSLFVDFGTDYADVFIHRIHARGGYLYNIPNTINRLSDPANPTYMQNGALAWPYLQCEHLHYDIPARKWSFNSDDLDSAEWQNNGTVKMVKKQETTILPMPFPADEYRLDHGVIGGLRDSLGNLQIGIVENATVNLSSRNCTLKLMYDIIA